VLAKLVLAVATVTVGVAAIDGAIQDTIAARADDHSAAATDLLLPAIAATPLMLATALTVAIGPQLRSTPRQVKEPADLSPATQIVSHALSRDEARARVVDF
jgi:hypothetical protein